MTERNALITKTTLGTADGPLMAWLHLEFDGSGQAFGGYVLGKGVASFWIDRVLTVVGVSNWEDLKGQHIRVRHDTEFGGIIAIGNFLKNSWFYPKEELRKEFPRD